MTLQTGPDPLELRDLIKNVRYKENWTFTLEDSLDRDQGCFGMTLVIQVVAPNSRKSDSTIRVNHYMIVPAAAYDRRSWQRWLFEQVLLVEKHEAAEFFCIGEERPYAPSHAPGNDPYTIKELATKDDVELDHLGRRREYGA